MTGFKRCVDCVSHEILRLEYLLHIDTAQLRQIAEVRLLYSTVASLGLLCTARQQGGTVS